MKPAAQQPEAVELSQWSATSTSCAFGSTFWVCSQSQLLGSMHRRGRMGAHQHEQLLIAVPAFSRASSAMPVSGSLCSGGTACATISILLGLAIQERCQASYMPLACRRPRLAASCLLRTLQRGAWTSPLSTGWFKWTVRRTWTPTSIAWGALRATYQVSLPMLHWSVAPEGICFTCGPQSILVCLRLWHLQIAAFRCCTIGQSG